MGFLDKVMMRQLLLFQVNVQQAYDQLDLA